MEIVELEVLICVYINETMNYFGNHDKIIVGGAASVVSRFSRAPQTHLPNLPTEMENIITDDQNWYSKQPSQH